MSNSSNSTLPPLLILLLLAQRRESPLYLPRLLDLAIAQRSRTSFDANINDLYTIPSFDPQIIATNPQLASMGPQMREMMRSPFFRQMM